ncbi:hypothetical protein ACLOJK_033492 [Asimina triloba]
MARSSTLGDASKHAVPGKGGEKGRAGPSMYSSVRRRAFAGEWERSSGPESDACVLNFGRYAAQIFLAFPSRNNKGPTSAISATCLPALSSLQWHVFASDRALATAKARPEHHLSSWPFHRALCILPASLAHLTSYDKSAAHTFTFASLFNISII